MLHAVRIVKRDLDDFLRLYLEHRLVVGHFSGDRPEFEEPNFLRLAKRLAKREQHGQDDGKTTQHRRSGLLDGRAAVLENE